MGCTSWMFVHQSRIEIVTDEIQVSSLHTALSYTVSPSTVFACPAVSSITTRDNSSICTTYVAVQAAPDMPESEAGQWLWLWTGNIDRNMDTVSDHKESAKVGLLSFRKSSTKLDGNILVSAWNITNTSWFRLSDIAITRRFSDLCEFLHGSATLTKTSLAIASIIQELHIPEKIVSIPRKRNSIVY